MSLPEILKVAVAGLRRHRRVPPRGSVDRRGRRRRDARIGAGAGCRGARGRDVPRGRLVDAVDASDATQVAAEAGRARGRSDPVAWAAAAAAHDGGRDDARGRVLPVSAGRGPARSRRSARRRRPRSREAHAIARRVGIMPLIGWIEALARRARLSLEPAVAAATAAGRTRLATHGA